MPEHERFPGTPERRKYNVLSGKLDDVDSIEARIRDLRRTLDPDIIGLEGIPKELETYLYTELKLAKKSLALSAGHIGNAGYRLEALKEAYHVKAILQINLDPEEKIAVKKVSTEPSSLKSLISKDGAKGKVIDKAVAQYLTRVMQMAVDDGSYLDTLGNFCFEAVKLSPKLNKLLSKIMQLKEFDVNGCFKNYGEGNSICQVPLF